MLLFTRSQFRRSSVAVAVGLIATATTVLANTSEAPSLAEYITAICTAGFRSARLGKHRSSLRMSGR